MNFNLIAAGVKAGMAEIVLADQAHDQGMARRVVLTFPLPPGSSETFARREDRLLAEARAIVTAAQEALDLR